MNTKKLFMLLAAVLLSSVSAFAQSGNNEPLKGDVNEDGTVDVADLVDVIKILKDAGGAVGEKMCYWYVGTEQVGADNFTDIATRIPESEIPATGSVSASGQYVYFVMPETYHIKSLVDANGSAIEYEFNDTFGYQMYKTVNTVNGTISYAIEQTVYYWYAGQTQPTSISGTPTADDENFTNNKWHTIGTTLTNIGKLVTGGVAGNTWYVAVPKDKYQPTAGDLSTPDSSWTIINTITIGTVQYSVYDTAIEYNRCATYLKVK